MTNRLIRAGFLSDLARIIRLQPFLELAGRHVDQILERPEGFVGGVIGRLLVLACLGTGMMLYRHWDLLHLGSGSHRCTTASNAPGTLRLSPVKSNPRNASSAHPFAVTRSVRHR